MPQDAVYLYSDTILLVSVFLVVIGLRWLKWLPKGYANSETRISLGTAPFCPSAYVLVNASRFVLLPP